ncbi:hypothetical protein BDR26DRAFT_702533 [Obelidium mucronatum]|nr:hypothetical protein BDR26DRAFT_702533 [Obelidium mucronatum]
MIQNDLQLAFFFGALFAASATGQLQGQSPWTAPSFVYSLAFIGLIMNPCTIYFFWDFPAWETMFMLDPSSIGALLPTLICVANLVASVAGFLTTVYLIKTKRDPMLPWIYAFTLYIAVVGLGYERVGYSGTYQDWQDAKAISFAEFFTSKLFFMLLAMFMTFFAVTMIPLLKWLGQTWSCSPLGFKKARRQAAFTTLKHALIGYASILGLFIAVALFSGAVRSSFRNAWGWGIVTFTIAELLFFGALVSPVAVFVKETSGRKPPPKTIED